jgi:hypothetical protein
MKTFISILIILFLCVFSCVFNVQAAELTYKQCVKGLWVGAVEFESKPGPGVKYKLRPDLRMMVRGIKTFTVDPGWYGITVYDPINNVVKDYASIHIRDNESKTITYCPQRKFSSF